MKRLLLLLALLLVMLPALGQAPTTLRQNWYASSSNLDDTGSCSVDSTRTYLDLTDLDICQCSASTWDCHEEGGGGSSLPVADTTSIAEGSGDVSKEVRFEVDGLTTSTVRVLTMADQNIDLTPGTGSFATEAEGALAATAVQDATTDTLTNKTIDASNNTITNLGSSEITPDIISGFGAAPAFESGDTFLILSAGVLEEADFDDLPGGGGITDINDIGNATGTGSVAVGVDQEYAQTWTWDLPATTVGSIKGITFAMNLDASTDAQDQTVVSIERNSTSGTLTLERLLLINNEDVDGAVTAGIEIQSAAGLIAIGIDADDPQIGVVLAIGANDAFSTTTGGTITEAELNIIADGLIDNTEASDMASYTIKLRNNVGSGDPQDVKISALTEEASPAALDWILGELAGGELRKFDVGNLPGGGGGGDITSVGDCLLNDCFTAGSPDAVLTFDNATSGTVTLQTVTGALGTVTVSLPAVTGILMTRLIEDLTPTFGGPVNMGGQCLGDGTNEILCFTATGGAINEVNIASAAISNGPVISAEGETNVPLNLRGKGIGDVQIQDSVDPTKTLRFDVGGSSSGVQTFLSTSSTGSANLTLPDATDTLVGKATTDAFTNKTLDADGTGNVITNIGSSEIKPEMISGFSAAPAFASGDTFLILSGGVLEEADFDDLPGGGSSDSFKTWTDGVTPAIADSATDTMTVTDSATIDFITADGPETLTANFLPAGVDGPTWGDNTTSTWIFAVGATDPTWAFASDLLTITNMATLTASSTDADFDDITATTITLDPSDTGAMTLTTATLGAQVSIGITESAGPDGIMDFNVDEAGTLVNYMNIYGTTERIELLAPLEVNDTQAAPTDPADTGAIRFDNDEAICWEAAPSGTDVCLQADASEIIQVSGGTFDAADLSGTVPVASVGADHLDAMSEIAAGIKRGPDATDTHILTTDVSAPGGLTCLNMDTDGSVVLAAGACAAAGGSDVDDVGPGCSIGSCLTDGVTTTGTDMFIWEGTVDNTDEVIITVPADPDFDFTLAIPQPTGARVVTLPDATTTLVGHDFAQTLTNKTIALGSNTVTGTSAEFDTANTDGNFAFSGGAFHDGFSDFLTAEHVDWAGASAGTIHITNFAALQNIVEDTSPQLGANLDVGTFDIVDANGNELIEFTVSGSADAHIEIQNKTSGGHPTVSAAGGLSDINLLLKGKGTGNVYITGGADSTKRLVVGLNGATTGASTTFVFTQTVNRSVTWPDAAGEVSLLGQTIGSTEIVAEMITGQSAAPAFATGDKFLIVSSGGLEVADFDDLPAGGSGDVDAVGPGCADGDCFTDGKVTTGTDLLIWEGTVDNADEFRITVPADPDFDTVLAIPQTAGPRTWTLPPATTTLIGKDTTDILTNKSYDADGSGNALTNVGSSEIKPDIISGFSAAPAFASGDTFLILSGGVLEEADFDDLPGAGGGDDVSVNGAAATNADFDDTTPAAPSNAVNVNWQITGASPSDVSANILLTDIDGVGIGVSGTELVTDLNGLTTQTTVADGDFLPFDDLTDTLDNKITFANLKSEIFGTPTGISWHDSTNATFVMNFLLSGATDPSLTFGNGIVTVSNATLAVESTLQLLEPSGGGTSFISFTAPALAGNRVCTLLDSVDMIPDTCLGGILADELIDLSSEITGTLPAAAVGNGLDDDQVLDNITIDNATTAANVATSVCGTGLNPNAGDCDFLNATNGGLTVNANDVQLNIADLTTDTIAGGDFLAFDDIGEAPDNKTTVDAFISTMGLAGLASPVFTGAPTTPTSAQGDADLSIASTAFVDERFQQECRTLEDATTADLNVPMFIPSQAVTIEEVACYADAAITISYQDFGETDIETLACDTDGSVAWDISMSGTATLITGEVMQIDVDSASSPTWTLICYRWSND